MNTAVAQQYEEAYWAGEAPDAPEEGAGHRRCAPDYACSCLFFFACSSYAHLQQWFRICFEYLSGAS